MQDRKMTNQTDQNLSQYVHWVVTAYKWTKSPLNAPQQQNPQQDVTTPSSETRLVLPTDTEAQSP